MTKQSGAAVTGIDGASQFLTWQRLSSAIFSSRLLALGDQAVVSGTSFLTTVLIGRFTSPSELGLYVLGMSLLIAAINLQQSLIALPYTIWHGRTDGDDPVLAGNSLLLASTLALTAAAVIAVVAGSMFAAGGNVPLTEIVAVLALVLPFILLRDFGRGFSTARLRFGELFALDAAVSFFQLTGLGILAWFDRLSGAAGLGVAGASCAIAAGMGVWLKRRSFEPRLSGLTRVARQSWQDGKWLLASLLTLVTQVQATYWLVAVFAGTAVTGIYAACMSIAGLATPMIMGLSIPMFAKAVAGYAKQGTIGLRRQTTRDVLLLASATAAFCAVILLIGDQAIGLLFGSKHYIGHRDVVLFLALWQMAHALGIPASNALLAMGRSRENFWHGVFGAAVSTVLVLVLVARWGASGAAFGLMFGTVVRTAARWRGLQRALAEVKVMHGSEELAVVMGLDDAGMDRSSSSLVPALSRLPMKVLARSNSNLRYRRGALSGEENGETTRIAPP